MLDMSKYEELFSTESREHISILNTALLRLEKEKDLTLLAEIFRSLHTLKGMAGSLGYEPIVNLSHKMEDVVQKLREGELSLDQSAIDLLLNGVDQLDWLVENRETTEEKGLEEIMGRLNGLLAGEPVSLPSSPDLEKPVLRKPKDLRITLTSLERLQDLIGDLVITREGLSRIVGLYHLDSVKDSLAALSRLTAGFQDEISRMRTIRFGQAYERLPRFVRDSARDLGKEIDFVIEGEDVELDRVTLDRLHDPLIHLLRNAVGHGIEPPDDRVKAGKDRTGTVTLKVERMREVIAISVADNGRGVDPKSVIKTAVKKKIISSKDSRKLSRQEILALIAKTGFTTSKKVTEVSGRGVGLDVVTEVVRNLGGTLEIDSEPGAGTRFIMKFPLTLAVARVLLARVGEGIYSIPLTQVIETVKVQPSEFRTVQARKVLVVRGDVLPIFTLAEILEISEDGYGPPPVQVVVCEAEAKRVGLVVDAIPGQTEVVIKPLDETFSRVEEFAGATVLGDGRPSLILDIARIIRGVEK